MPIHQGELNRQTAEACSFLARFLAQRIAAARVADEPEGHVTIHLDCPYGAEQPIRIDTRNGEITVGFAYCHSHFSSSEDAETETHLVGEMIEKVVLIVSGAELCVLVRRPRRRRRVAAARPDREVPDRTVPAGDVVQD